MKQFATPLSITGDHNEIDKLIPELISLGYNTDNFNSLKHDHNYLLTNFVKNGRLGWNQDASGIVVYIGDKELVLALAAMVEGNIFHKGEYLKCTQNYGDQFTKDRLYKQRRDYGSHSFGSVEADNNGVPNGVASFVKATKEEIVQHFNQKNMSDTSGRSTGQAISQSVAKDTVKKIIGWNVKPGIDRIAALKSIGWERNTAARGYELKHESDAYNEAIKLGVLSALFVPVYEEDKRTVKVGVNNYDIYSDYIVYDHSNISYKFTRADLEELIARHGDKFSIAEVPYITSLLNFGCNSQITVSIYDIRTLLSYLK